MPEFGGDRVAFQIKFEVLNEGNGGWWRWTRRIVPYSARERFWASVAAYEPATHVPARDGLGDWYPIDIRRRSIEQIEAAIRTALPARLRDYLAQGLGELANKRRELVKYTHPYLKEPPPVGSPAYRELSIRITSLSYGSITIAAVFAGLTEMGRAFGFGIEDVTDLLEPYAALAFSDVFGLPADVIAASAIALPGYAGEPPLATRTDARDKTADLFQRQWRIANTSLILPFGLAIAVCYLAFEAMTEARKEYARKSADYVDTFLKQNLDFAEKVIKHQRDITDKVIEHQNAVIKSQDSRIRDAEAAIARALELVRDMAVQEQKERARRSDSVSAKQ